MSELIRTHRSAVADYTDRLISKRDARRRWRRRVRPVTTSLGNPSHPTLNRASPTSQNRDISL